MISRIIPTAYIFLVCVSILCEISKAENLYQSKNSDLADQSTTTRTAPPYNGEWDISAKQTAVMCQALKHKDYDGSSPLPEPSRESYLRDGVCWKNAWIPCENNNADDRLAKTGPLSHRRKPCGHFRMIVVSNRECVD